MRRDAQQPEVTHDVTEPRRFHRTGVAHFVSEKTITSQASVVNALAGPYGLHAALGVMLALFAGFIYVFNYTSFF